MSGFFALWWNIQRAEIQENPWSFLLSILVFIFVIIGYIRWQKWKTDMYWAQRNTLEKLREMDPFRFEEFVAIQMRKQGYSNVKVTVARQDGGYDLSAYKNKKIYIAQIKRYKATNKLIVDEVRKIYGIVKKLGDENIPLLITTGYLTKTAIEESQHYGVEYWDADNILQNLGL